MEPLGIERWINEASDRGLIVTLDGLASLPLGVMYWIVPLELSRFLLYQYPHRFPVPARGSVLAPPEFFAPLRMEFRRTSDIFREPQWALPSSAPLRSADSAPPCLTASIRHPDVAYHQDQNEGGHFYTARRDRHAHSGSGDGWTRYIMWSVLAAAGMPPVVSDVNVVI